MAGTVLTNSGRALLHKALTGKKLTFTRAFTGTGTLSAGRNQSELTDLVSRKQELPITAMRTSSSGTAEITVEISNLELSSGYFIREYGLFAKDPDNDSEILYAYCYKGDEASYFEGYDGTNPVHHVVSFVTVIDQAQNVTAVIDASHSYVTPSMLDMRFVDLFGPAGDTAGFFSYEGNETKRLRPLPLTETKRVIIGLTDIAALISRVERLEDAMNKTALALNVQEIYPGASCFMAEDFLEPDTVDLYSANVTSIVAGDDSIDCDPIDGMLPGSWYTVTDGANSELVQAESINLENGIMRVILTGTIQNSYNLEACRILRTTADVQDGTAYGAAVRRNAVWIPGTEWRGRSAMSDYSIPLDTSVSRSSAFNFTGSAVITSDGFLSLGR